MGILQARILEWVVIPPPKDLPNPGFKPRSPALWADSLPSEPLGKPKNTGVASLSLFQRIFLTQELTWDRWHCGWILYQLSQKGSPRIRGWVACPFSSGSSRPRNRTRVSYIAGRFFTDSYEGSNSFSLVIDDTVALDCVLNSCCSLCVLFYIWLLCLKN